MSAYLQYELSFSLPFAKKSEKITTNLTEQNKIYYKSKTLEDSYRKGYFDLKQN